MPMLLAGMTAPSYPASSNVMAPLDNESPVQLQVGQNASSMGDVASYHVANPMAHHLPIRAGSNNPFKFWSEESC